MSDIEFPNYLNTFITSAEAGRQAALQNARRNALSMVDTDPTGAQNALMKTGDFQGAEAVGQVAQRQQQTAGRAKAADLYAKGDTKGAISTALSIDPQLAQTYASLDKTNQDHLKEVTSQRGAVAFHLLQDFQKDPAAAIQQWDGWIKPQMQQRGLLTDADLAHAPDPHQNPQAFAQWLHDSSADSMTTVQQYEQIDKDRTFGETVRSHQADEGHAAAQLGETTRHNKVDERSQQTDQALRRQQIAGEGWQVMVDPANGNQPYRINARTGAAVTLDGQPYQPKGVMKVGSNTARSGTAMAVQKFLEENPNATAEDVAKFNSHLRAQAAGQTAFNSGPLGSKVRSLNVAVDHLETLQGVANALGNGDVQALNRLKQNFQQQFGSAIPTNFDATKQLVAGEVANVVAAGGSTMHDRQEAEAIINRAGSPQQLTGAIKQVKRLMAGQVKGLRLQYQSSTGMDDFETHLLPATRSELESLDNGGTAAPAQGGRPPLASFGR